MAMKGLLHIPQISKARALLSVGLMLYQGHSLGGSYSSVEMQSVYSTAPADWAGKFSKIYYRLNKEKRKIIWKWVVKEWRKKKEEKDIQSSAEKFMGWPKYSHGIWSNVFYFLI